MKLHWMTCAAFLAGQCLSGAIPALGRAVMPGAVGDAQADVVDGQNIERDMVMARQLSASAPACPSNSALMLALTAPTASAAGKSFCSKFIQPTTTRSTIVTKATTVTRGGKSTPANSVATGSRISQIALAPRAYSPTSSIVSQYGSTAVSSACSCLVSPAPTLTIIEEYCIYVTSYVGSPSSVVSGAVSSASSSTVVSGVSSASGSSSYTIYTSSSNAFTFVTPSSTCGCTNTSKLSGATSTTFLTETTTISESSTFSTAVTSDFQVTTITETVTAPHSTISTNSSGIVPSSQSTHTDSAGATSTGTSTHPLTIFPTSHHSSSAISSSDGVTFATIPSSSSQTLPSSSGLHSSATASDIVSSGMPTTSAAVSSPISVPTSHTVISGTSQQSSSAGSILLTRSQVYYYDTGYPTVVVSSTNTMAASLGVSSQGSFTSASSVNPTSPTSFKSTITAIGSLSTSSPVFLGATSLGASSSLGNASQPALTTLPASSSTTPAASSSELTTTIFTTLTGSSVPVISVQSSMLGVFTNISVSLPLTSGSGSSTSKYTSPTSSKSTKTSLSAPASSTASSQGAAQTSSGSLYASSVSSDSIAISSDPYVSIIYFTGFPPAISSSDSSGASTSEPAAVSSTAYAAASSSDYVPIIYFTGFPPASPTSESSGASTSQSFVTSSTTDAAIISTGYSVTIVSLTSFFSPSSTSDNSGASTSPPAADSSKTYAVASSSDPYGPILYFTGFPPAISSSKNSGASASESAVISSTKYGAISSYPSPSVSTATSKYPVASGTATQGYSHPTTLVYATAPASPITYATPIGGPCAPIHGCVKVEHIFFNATAPITRYMCALICRGEPGCRSFASDVKSNSDFGSCQILDVRVLQAFDAVESKGDCVDTNIYHGICAPEGYE